MLADIPLPYKQKHTSPFNKLLQMGSAPTRPDTRDLASGPVLFDVTVDGRTVKGVASLGKTCYVYMLNRETGEPIYGVEEQAVAASDVPDEASSPTQPIPVTSRTMSVTTWSA